MKTQAANKQPARSGGALIITIILTAIALAILGGAMAWSAGTTRQTHRSMQYSRTIAAAEGATEKVLTEISQDYLKGDFALVTLNLSKYRTEVPKPSDSKAWNQWQFSDAKGLKNHTSVDLGIASNYTVLGSTYAGLRGFVSSYTITSHAQEKDTLLKVGGGVSQEIQLASIPIFQFAMYSSGDMEISCGQPFNVTGRVHSNKILYVEPDSLLTFQSDVTAVGDIVLGRNPLDTRGDLKGGAVYVFPEKKKDHVPAMTLPIGVTNTPEAIREIILPPPPGENASSPMGRLRYYNKSDLIITVTDIGTTVTSGRYDNFATTVPATEVALFVSTANSFWDAREEKTVKPIDLNIGLLKAWSETNSNVRSALHGVDVSSVYVVDNRKSSGTTLGAVRVNNGLMLPSRGLTVSTARPLYVNGHFNSAKLTLGSTNTVNTKPASLVGDAITLLSINWQDLTSSLPVASRIALPTTVNAAFLTGAVETTAGKYSGGMENFPRFLETWGLANALTYNGSMVKMFPSQYATNAWGKGNVYGPPKRDWAFDLNFNNAAKLPPCTPSLVYVIRGNWKTVASIN